MLVACDLIGIAADLSGKMWLGFAAAQTGIPTAHIVLAATDWSAGPDYTPEPGRLPGGGCIGPRAPLRRETHRRYR